MSEIAEGRVKTYTRAWGDVLYVVSESVSDPRDKLPTDRPTADRCVEGAVPISYITAVTCAAWYQN